MKNSKMKKSHGHSMGHGPMHGMRRGEKAKNFKGSMIQLMKYLSQFKLAIFITIVCAIISALFTIVGPTLLGNVTQVIYEGIMNIISVNGKGMEFDRIIKILFVLALIYLTSSAAAYAQGWLMSGVTMKITYQLRKEIAAKIHRLPLSYYDKKSHGEVLSHMTNDVDTLSQSLNQSITQVITSSTTLIGVLFMMFSISWQMAIISLLVLPVSFIFVMQVVKHSQKYFVNQQSFLGNVNGHIEEMYGAHIIVKAFNGEKSSIEEFEHLSNQLYEAGWKAQFTSGMMMPIMNLIGNIGYVIVCILGGYYATHGIINVGNILSFIQYMKMSTHQVQQVANISNILQQTAAASERVFEFLNEEEEEADTQYPLPVDELHGDVIFAHVNFGYDPNVPIINDFTASIKQGQKVAIVGPTGAGKTTLIKLLMRFYDVTSGAICIDGLDLKQFKRNDLRSVFGMVLQDTWLYNASIKENIRYGKQDATDEEVYEAAKAAQVDHFVKTLPDGYNMILNEESSNISQGQKQLLTIARAILSDPKVLILDEATSSVDTRTEILIQKAMDALMKGRTSFVIAHRLSTIRDADMILCMDHGDIVEQGTHDELLAKNGFYAKLYNSQFEVGEE